MNSDESHLAPLPSDDQMVTAVVVHDGNVKVIAGRVLVAKRRGVVVNFDLDGEPGGKTSAPAERGQTVTLLYGGGERVLRVRTVVAELIDGRKLLLEPTGPVTEGERREFLRAELQLRISAAQLRDGAVPATVSAGLAQRVGERPLQTVDLSGSGAKFIWDGPIDRNSQVALAIALPSPVGAVVTGVADVVRAEPLEGGHVDLAVHFVDLGEAARDDLINAVFHKYYEALGARMGAAMESE